MRNITSKMKNITGIKGVPSINLNNSSLVKNISVQVTLYKNIIVLFAILFALILTSYYISENYRISLVLDDMKTYNDIMQISDTSFTKDDMKNEYRLCDYYVASSFRSVIGKNQLLDYCSNRILKQILRSGARFIWLDIFNSDMSSNTLPVVGNGYKEGNWNLVLNTLPFEECCKTIAENAFTSGSVNNPNDPLILGLNLNTQNNLYSLKKIKKSILKHLGHKLLDVHYGYNKADMGQLPMSLLKKKVIIFSSSGFEQSDLAEIINGCWDDSNMRKLVYKSIDPNIKVTEYVKENLNSLKNFNTNGLTIITPDPNTLFTRQYMPNYAWNNGCQFVNMYYQKLDNFMNEHINLFKNKSFVLKPKNLRSKIVNKKKITNNVNEQMFGSNENEDSNKFNNCPLIPN
jgi:hypothetical protein